MLMQQQQNEQHTNNAAKNEFNWYIRRLVRSDEDRRELERDYQIRLVLPAEEVDAWVLPDIQSPQLSQTS